MTTPQPPLPPAKNEAATPVAKVAWYQVPVVWLGIVLSLVIVAGCIHLVFTGHQQQDSIVRPSGQAGELTHVLGMPLSRPADQAEAAKAETVDPASNNPP